MSKTAFALRPEYRGEGAFTGGTVTAAGINIDLLEALEHGHGQIVVEDTHSELIAQLEACPVLESAEPAKGARALRLWALQPRLALNEEAARRRVDGYLELSDSKLAAELQRQDAAASGGEPEPDDDDQAAADAAKAAAEAEAAAAAVAEAEAAAEAERAAAEAAAAAADTTGKPAGSPPRKDR